MEVCVYINRFECPSLHRTMERAVARDLLKLSPCAPTATHLSSVCLVILLIGIQRVRIELCLCLLNLRGEGILWLLVLRIETILRINE